MRSSARRPPPSKSWCGPEPPRRASAARSFEGQDPLQPLLRGNHTEEPERLIPDVLELVLFIGGDVDGVPRPHLVHLPSQEDPGPPPQGDHSLSVAVVPEPRLPAGS